MGGWVDLGMVKYLTLLLFIGLGWGQEFNFHKELLNKDSDFKNHCISVGIFDDKLGLSTIGYSYNIKMNEMNELFFGGGTFLLVHTLAGGFKHYYRKSNLSIHSTFSIKRMFLDNEYSGTGTVNLVSSSLSLEYNISKWAQIKLGGVGVIDDAEGNNEFWAFPFTGINFTF